jgi:O-antigen/teichoic acid export membrane protein
MTRSILSNWFGLLVMAASTALLTPIMIHHLGTVEYGVWVLASSVLDYYGLLDLGMRSAMFRYVALFRGGSEREEIDRTFSSALFLVTVTAVFICGLSFAVAYFLPRFMPLPGTSPRAFSSVLGLLGISIAIMFPTRMLATYISAHQRWDLYNAAGIVAVITRAVTIVVLLKLGYGILAIAIGTVAIAILSLGQHVLFVFRADPRVHASVSGVSARRIRELFGFSLRSLLVSIGDYLRFYSDSVVIAAVLNVGLVTPFNVATRLIECFKSVVVAAGGPVFGAMTELDGGCRQKELQHVLLWSTRLLGLLSVLGGVLLLVDGRILLRLWVGNELVSAYPIVAILALGYTLNLALHPMLLIVISKGQHGPLGWWTIAEGIANIVLSVIWGISHGLIGIAMGTIVPMLVVKLIIQPYYALKAAEISLSEYCRKGLLRAFVVGVFFFFAGRGIAASMQPANLWFFGAVVLIQVFVFAGLTLVFGLTGTERQWVYKYGQRHFSFCLPRRRRQFSQQPTEPDLA